MISAITVPRITLPTLLVLKALLETFNPSLSCICSHGYNPDCQSTHGALASWSGYQLALNSGVSRGSIYPILYRLEDAGWISSEIDYSIGKKSTKVEGKKRTYLRLYRLTDEGRRRTEELLRSVGQ